jgi:hypothetical protein
MEYRSTDIEPEEFLSHCGSFHENAYLFYTSFMASSSGERLEHFPTIEIKYG